MEERPWEMRSADYVVRPYWDFRGGSRILDVSIERRHKIHKEKCGKARDFWRDDQTVTSSRASGTTALCSTPTRSPSEKGTSIKPEQQKRVVRCIHRSFIPAEMKKHLNELRIYAAKVQGPRNQNTNTLCDRDCP